jgi:hypothetical protein
MPQRVELVRTAFKHLVVYQTIKSLREHLPRHTEFPLEVVESSESERDAADYESVHHSPTTSERPRQRAVEVGETRPLH